MYVSILQGKSMKKWLLGGMGDGFRIFKVLVLVAIPVGILLFHVWGQYRITKLGYEVAEQTSEHRSLIEEQRKLTIEATFQGRSERVLTVAKERFGLEPMHPEQVIQVEPNAADGTSGEQASLDLVRP
jgi:cell division protein FtsL